MRWLLALALLAAPASAEQVGYVDLAQADAFQSREVVGHRIGETDPIYRNARIYTKLYGSVKIVLRDGSDLMITPNSSIVIDDYVFAGDGDTMAFRLTRGAVRMVSGRLAKERVLAVTEIAHIGIRGTQFWLDVDTPDLLRIWIQEGAVVARPVQTDEEFVFEAPLYAECTVTTCLVTEPPDLPEAFPRDPRAR